MWLHGQGPAPQRRRAWVRSFACDAALLSRENLDIQHHTTLRPIRSMIKWRMLKVRAWKACAANQMPLIVLEDDAKPAAKFGTVLRQALRDVHGQEPDILYLGYSKAAPWRGKVSAVVREAEYLWTTVAYVLWPSGAAALLGSLPVDQPVDNFIAQRTADNKLRAFATVPVLALCSTMVLCLLFFILLFCLSQVCLSGGVCVWQGEPSATLERGQ
ncbi:COLGALT1 [Symbiodinium natans]|uniref:COLGALT1 protein n=1 Tax=Symbiodinium natans TaxID=878477 RepID=A0A812U3Z1_9DINO|nr:COLGALT1 [Symbiodinium natans]